MEYSIIPAIIANNQKELDSMLECLKGRVTRVMLDFMDERFVSNTSLNFDVKLPPFFEYEAHLMVAEPIPYFDNFAKDLDWVMFHIETLSDVNCVINKAKRYGLKVGLALKPATSLNHVLPYLDEIDGILIMTVEPGRYGGTFLPETLEKIRRLRRLAEKIFIEVDGGMNPINVKAARIAGANAFASGSYILKSNDVQKAIKELEDAIFESNNL